jgi:hypothetical protein
MHNSCAPDRGKWDSKTVQFLENRSFPTESGVGTGFALRKTGLIDLFRPGSSSPPGRHYFPPAKRRGIFFAGIRDIIRALP